MPRPQKAQNFCGEQVTLHASQESASAPLRPALVWTEAHSARPLFAAEEKQEVSRTLEGVRKKLAAMEVSAGLSGHLRLHCQGALLQQDKSAFSQHFPVLPRPLGCLAAAREERAARVHGSRAQEGGAGVRP